MDGALKGRLLMVGEGDFSFAVSLLSRCHFDVGQVVVSSLETEETIQKHQLATENRQILERQGVKVCFEVDATELQTCGALQVTEDAKFSRIIFNFPHAGGKSNHKKNRALLNNFFSSAVKVLGPEGQIMVTLCKGQGGTPADQPMRAWHDSWQVVSMAANASLILTKVLPFRTEDYPVYNSVGFRSQDKGFHTEGALTHVFEMAVAVPTQDMTENNFVNLGGKSYSCVSYLKHKLNRKLLYSPHHPLHQLRTRLEEHLSTELTSQAHHLDISSLVKEDLAPRLISNDGDGQTNKAWLKHFFPDPYFLTEDSKHNCDISSKEERNMEEKEQDDTELAVCAHSVKDSEGRKGDDQMKAHLRTSVVEELYPVVSLMASSGVGCHVVSCDVYGQCLIEQHTSGNSGQIRHEMYPVRHEMMLVCRDISVDKTLEAVSRSLQKSTGFDYNSVQVRESVNVISDFGNMQITHKIELGNDKCDSDMKEVCGCVLKWKNSDDESILLIIVLDLSSVVLTVHCIPSHSLLWSTDPRFREQFTNCSSFVVKFQPISLYPMKYCHDLSFWESPLEQFDEQMFHSIVRNVTGDVVTGVKLIDSYHDDESDRRSCCYRLTFQSHDQALSYITSWKLQSMLRLEVAKKMGVSLR